MALKIPIFRPDLPRLSSLSHLFDQMHDCGIYSNNGPLLRRFEAQFVERCGGQFFMVGQANGTLAIQTAILAKAGFATPDKKICLMPAFAFSASVSAVLAAGYEPHFIDVDRETWMPDPDSLAAHQLLNQTGLVVVTGAFGDLPDLAGWARFAERTGVSVIIDGAACADAFLSGAVKNMYGLPVALSFHATKPFGLGEGGAVIGDNETDIISTRKCANFGFGADRESAMVGTNSKMSEITAAIGLGLLDQWDERRAKMMWLVAHYHDAFGPSSGFRIVRDWVTTYPHVLADDEIHRAQIVERLDNAGIGHRRWWGIGCHRHPAYEGFGCDPVPVTDGLAKTMIGLPFFPNMTKLDIDTIKSTIMMA